MTGILKVTPQELRTISGEFEADQTEVSSLTSQMLTLIAGLTGSIWSGEAASAYREKFASLSTDMEKIKAKIQEHIEDLLSMAGAYEQAEQEASEGATALKTDVL